MKKFIFSLLVLSLILGLSACTAEDPGLTPGVPTGTPGSYPTEYPLNGPTVTPSGTFTPAPVTTPAAPGQLQANNCTSEPQFKKPDGLIVGSHYVAQIGANGCYTIFEGRIFEAGQSGPADRHDLYLVDGAKDNFAYWEGSLWTFSKSTDPKSVAGLLWDGKKTNWIKQGINPLPLKLWNFPVGFSL
ncbi:hypothetical protein HGA88_02315 [Candidatus Roizmanbacteria bacterium]|nr:hypothetical protein [Candidatus Roizmanbacteria bacterium]